MTQKMRATVTLTPAQVKKLWRRIESLYSEMECEPEPGIDGQAFRNELSSWYGEAEDEAAEEFDRLAQELKPKVCSYLLQRGWPHEMADMAAANVVNGKSNYPAWTAIVEEVKS